MSAQNTPTTVVQSAFAALSARDWTTLASLVDSEALASIRQDALGMLILTTEQRLAGEKTQGGYDPQVVVIADHLARVGDERIKGFRGKPTIAQLASLSLSDFFVEWARASYGDKPARDPVSEVVGLHRRIIGEVIENQDTAEVVYRREHRHADMTGLKIGLPGEVRAMPLVRRGGRWGLRANDDIGWSIDFGDIVFGDRGFRSAMTMPPRVIPPVPPAPLRERTTATPTPVQVVESAFDAFTNRDWARLSSLVDAGELRSFQQEQLAYFAAWIQGREERAQSKREGLTAFMLIYDDSLPPEAVARVAALEVPLRPEPRRIGELAELAPAEFFQAWCRAAYGSEGAIGTWKNSFERRVIGQVFEGETLAYVLYRSPRLYLAEIMPLRWSDSGWRILLNDDIGWIGDLQLDRDEP